MKSKTEILEFERKWALPAGIMAMAAVAIYVGAQVWGGTQFSTSGGQAEALEAIKGHYGAVTLSTILQGIGIVLLAGPLVYLFLAEVARSERVRTAFLGLMIVGPLFLGIASGLSGATLVAASKAYDANSPAITKCVDQKTKDAETSGDKAKPTSDELDTFKTDCADDEAKDLKTSSGPTSLATGFGIAGSIAFAISVVYAALWAMRIGLLTRFWASLGMALGAVSIIPYFFIFVLIWFLFLGLIIAGWIPRGRPPAWAAAEAIPWLLPGEELDEDDDVIEGTGEPVDNGDLTDREAGPEARATGERIKRKKRRLPPE